MQRVAIVGASLAGLRTAEALRAKGFNGEIVVLGAEPHMPYNRPPLSKLFLTGAIEEPALAFPADPQLGTWRLDCPVVAADLAGHTVTCADGETLEWDKLVIASGVRPRRLPQDMISTHHFALRTVDDARQLANRLHEVRTIAVIGAGFIGCEVASTARSLGVRPVLIAPEPEPMYTAVGAAVGRFFRRLHERNTVDLRLRTAVTGYANTPAGRRLELGDGEVLDVGAVIEAIGSVPNVEWLEGNGLELSAGVSCDNQLRVAGTCDVVAVGDVARFPNPLFGGAALRIEHWTMPTAMAARAAMTLLGPAFESSASAGPFMPVPSFWTEQFGVRLQAIGCPALGIGDVRVDIEDDMRPALLARYFSGDALVGAVSVGCAKDLGALRAELLASAP